MGRKEGMKSIGAILFIVVIGVLFLMMASEENDERIERMEQKIDAIHRVVVGARP